MFRGRFMSQLKIDIRKRFTAGIQFRGFAEVMHGRDAFDSTCIAAPSSCFMQGRPISGIIVGIPKVGSGSNHL